MDEEIAVVAQNPLTLVVAFDAGWQPADLPLQLEADFIADRLVLTCVGAGTDDEMVGETGDAGKVENPDVFGLFFLRGADRDEPCWLGRFLCTGTF